MRSQFRITATARQRWTGPGPPGGQPVHRQVRSGAHDQRHPILWAFKGCTLLLILLTWLPACAPQEPVRLQGGGDVVEGPRDFLRGYRALNPDGTVNAVIEIPAGTSAKWEVDKSDGALRWERRGDGYRMVQYLPYPANYGMIPQTLLPSRQGGDGDPLDVVVLSPALNRGTVVPVRLIGVLRLLDQGERDDKLLAVVPGTPMGEVEDLSGLMRDYPGAAQVVETWFSNYKGPGQTVSEGVAGVEEATAVLQRAMADYRSANPAQGPPGNSPQPQQKPPDDSGGEASQGQDRGPQQ